MRRSPQRSASIAAPRALAVAALAATFGCSRSTPPHAPDAPSAPLASAAPGLPTAPGAPVLVTLVVDQLAAWVLSERALALPDAGGFARLRREGTWVRQARHGHAATDTAPGHAALYTGVSPHRSGIFGNEIVDPTSRKRVSILRDPSTRLVSPEGELASPGSSAAALRSPTLADALRAAAPGAFIASISLKDRGAIPGGGRAPDAALWFDPKADAFVTSTAFARALPAWAVAEGDRAAVRRHRAAPWALLRPAWVEQHAATPDAQPGEGDIEGFGTVFPHDFTRSKTPEIAFRASPVADERIVALAIAALADPRVGAVPTLLALSLSSNDYVGHVFGPDSWEAWDDLARLDASLARLFDALDARVGPSRWAALLSADHGTTPMPETAAVRGARPWCNGAAPDPWARPCAPGGRLFMEPMGRSLDAAARKALGGGDWVAGVADPWVFLTEQARALEPARRRTLLAALRADLAANPLVQRTFVADELASPCPPPSDESLEALVCRSFVAGSGDVYVVPAEGAFFDPDYVVGKGTSHGSPRLHDRAVPLLVRAPGRARAGHVVDEPIAIAAFARTAASLLGIAPPDGARDGSDLAPPPSP